jgi:hypothetical protein
MDANHPIILSIKPFSSGFQKLSFMFITGFHKIELSVAEGGAWVAAFLFLFLFFILIPNSAFAKSESGTMNDERMRLYRKVESLTRVPWYYLAAIDQYELNIRLVRRDLPKPAGFSGLLIPEEKWAGMLNPNQTDTNPLSIRFFGGMGRDGNGDGLADRNDPEDALFSIADYIRQYGTEEEWIKIALWDYYQRDKTVGIITNISKLFRTFGTVNLDDKQFPFALNVNFSYRDTWGHKRGWGAGAFTKVRIFLPDMVSTSTPPAMGSWK